MTERPAPIPASAIASSARTGAYRRILFAGVPPTGCLGLQALPNVADFEGRGIAGELDEVAGPIPADLLDRLDEYRSKLSWRVASMQRAPREALFDPHGEVPTRNGEPALPRRPKES
jgi:hypothetical protein